MSSPRPEAWITKRDPDEIETERLAALDRGLPLAGMTIAVKDNIDVAGLPTTCACPAFSYTPSIDAPSVARLRAAGGVVIGKTNMDQFATGLVGTRSPYGAVRDVRRQAFVSGGSSAGSAVVVALGEVDIALGTDTAGSGRVPAAFQGVVGTKPSIGLIPTKGVVPACQSFDCVSVFAGSVDLAERAVAVMSGGALPVAAREPRNALAVFPQSALAALSPGYAAAFKRTCNDLASAGVDLVEIDPQPFLAAGKLLYGGAFVAERYAAVGDFVESNIGLCDPTVAEIILSGRGVPAAAYIVEWGRLGELRARASATLVDYDGLLLPTAPYQPTIAEVAADPIGVNERLGVFTTFCNMLDLCAYAIPAGTADGGEFGVTLFAPSGADRAVADLARTFGGSPPRDGRAGPPRDTIALLVVGAHMTGMPLNHQLREFGGSLLGRVQTTPAYRMFALDTVPPKPGLVRSENGSGAAIAGELWALPTAGLGAFLAEIPRPMALGKVGLSDGREVVGFLCEPAALDSGVDITAHGGWRRYLLARAA